MSEEIASNSVNEKTTVKGPSVLEFQSVEKANDYYMDYNFPDWREGFKTRVIPPVYEMHHEEVTCEKDTGYIPSRKDVEVRDRQGQLAEITILNTFTNYGRKESQPMFIFHDFRFKNIEDFGKNQLKLNIDMGEHQETDLIIVHRQIGIVLVETKSGTKGVYSKAKGQLEEAEKLLRKNEYFALPSTAERVIKKVIAFPELIQGDQDEAPRIRNFYILQKADLANFDKWWNDRIKTCEDSEYNELCNEIYCNLVPKLLCGRGDICVCLNMQKSAEKLDGQKTLNDLAKRKSNNSEKMKILRTSEVDSDVSILKRVWAYLTLEQSKAWKHKKQVICGPYGCGKTVLLQCKAAAFAKSGERVLVIVPKHLLLSYNNFFKKYGLENSNLQIISREKMYKDFEYYRDIAKEMHVFVDELLWLYTTEESEETVLTSNSEMARLEYSIAYRNYTKVSTADALDSKEFDDINVDSNSGHDIDSSMDCPWEYENPGILPSGHDSENEDDSENENDQYSQLSSISNSDDSNSYYHVSNKPSPIHNETNSCNTAHDSDHLVAQLIAKTHNYKPNIEFLKLLKELLTEENRYYVWVVPHLYITVKKILCNFQASNGDQQSRASNDDQQLQGSNEDQQSQAFDDVQASDEVQQFLLMCKAKNLPITKLKTVMRTSKQINDFKTQKEWEDFCYACFCDEKLFDVFSKHEILKALFESCLGHAITAHSVEQIIYPTQCNAYDFQAWLCETHLHSFYRFAAKVIGEKIKELMQNPIAIKFESTENGQGKYQAMPLRNLIHPQHIVIIGDYKEQYLHLDFIKELLHNEFQLQLCTVEEQQKDNDKVAICTSRDIASLEWPVVIHIKPSIDKRSHFQDNQNSSKLKLQIPFFDTDDNIIISRCKLHYILISRQDDNYETYRTSLNCGLDTDKGKIHDLRTLLTKDAKPKPGGFQKLYGK